MSTDHSAERISVAANVDFYDATYGRFDETLYREIRRETWVEDIGQNGWITAKEQDRFIEWLSLGPRQRLLDVAWIRGSDAADRGANRSRGRRSGHPFRWHSRGST